MAIARRLNRGVSPSRLLVFSFAAVIAVGTLLLLLPISEAENISVSPVDAFFTSTSAVCVTGLVVLDTGTDYSLSGQIIILLLIQVGGLGILTFSNLILLAAGRKLSLSDRLLVQETHGESLSVSPARLIQRICLYSLVIEAIGSVLLFLRFQEQYQAPRAAWLAVFHSISAFCNAGFSLFTASFVNYRDDVWVNSVLMVLIILGGLGFIVFADLFSFVRRWIRRSKHNRVALHTRVVLRTTVGLILMGAVVFYILELTGAFEGQSLREAILPSLFLSVTSRTAGFNTLNSAHLTNATLLCVIVLMTIGASPGSTGGGIKTTTFATLWALMLSRGRNRPAVEIGNRTVPSEIVAKALATTAGFIIAVLLGVILLQITEYAGEPHDTIRGSFLEHLFEVVSALGTVGLSTGVTPTLSVGGKLVISLCMFVGRLGPLVIAGSLIGRRERAAYTLPQERLMIG